MKTQIKFQKILAFVSLVIAALVFVYALIFNSGNLSNLMFYNNWENMRFPFEGADNFLAPAQTFTGALIVIGIVDICAVAVLFITACDKRRNYYVTNYVAIGLNIAMSVFVALFGIIFIAILMSEFYGMDWNALEKLITLLKEDGNQPYKEVSKSPAIFIVGIVLFIIVLANALAWTYNLIWKIKLMKGEKALLASGLVREVA